MSRYKTQYSFEAGGEGWVVIDFDDDEMTIKETRCNGQEDCHMMATLQRVDGAWKLEQPNMIAEEAGERVAAAVEAFVTENGPPQTKRGNGGNEPDEELGPWEHASEPMPHEDFATLRAVLEDPEPPSSLGHGAALVTALVAARRLWDEAARGRRSSERYAEELSAGTLPRHELIRLGDRLLRLEVLFMDPDELAREPAESLDELRTMPGGAPLQLGRLAALERAVMAQGSFMDGLSRIADAIERATRKPGDATSAWDELWEKTQWACSFCGSTPSFQRSSSAAICEGCAEEVVHRAKTAEEP